MEKYNGWTNRETWALFTHLTNDIELYDWARDVLKGCNDPEYFAGSVEDFLLNTSEWPALNSYEQESQRRIGRLQIVADIGSLWRVDYRAVVNALTE